MDLSILIVNWNSVAYTRQCLASIVRNANIAVQYEVIVIDNASYDGCDQMMRSEFPGMTFIQSDENLGFARANNLAFAASSGRNILFLNPDTEIQDDAIQKLYGALELIPAAGMVGARLLNSDFSLQTTCVVALPSILNQTLNLNLFRRAFPRLRMWGMRPLFEDPQEPVKVEAISGACMMARRHLVERVGGFTTDFFMYSEDMDLCLKIAKTGCGIFYVPGARIVHHAAGSSSRREETNFSSVMLRESLASFMEMHRGHRYALLYRFVTGLIAAVRLLLLLLATPIAISDRGRPSVFSAFSKWWGILVWCLGFNQWARQQNAIAQSISRSSAVSTRS